MDINEKLIIARQYSHQGKKIAARRLLRSVISLDPQNEMAWQLFCDVAENKKDEIYCLRVVLKINPSNQWASQRLAELTSQLVSSEEPNKSLLKSFTSRVNLRLALLFGIFFFIIILALVTFSQMKQYWGSGHSVPAIEKPTAPVPTTEIITTITPPPWGKWKFDSFDNEYTGATFGDLFLKADYYVEGMNKRTLPEIHIQCGGDSLYLLFWIGMPPTLSGANALVHLRIDSDPEITEYMSVDEANRWLQVKEPDEAKRIIHSMIQHNVLRFEFTPMLRDPVTTTFTIMGLKYVIENYLSEYCTLPLS
jgi:hypothetical protein